MRGYRPMVPTRLLLLILTLGSAGVMAQDVAISRYGYNNNPFEIESRWVQFNALQMFQSMDNVIRDYRRGILPNEFIEFDSGVRDSAITAIGAPPSRGSPSDR